MKKNMGNIDKTLRLILAALIGILYFTNTISGTLGIVLLIAAIILVLTSFIGVCPLYSVLNIKTLNKK